MKFTDLDLSEDVLRAVADAGYESPTPIQAQAIPQVLMGRDILGCAQTGTGKTASFTLPMIDILASGKAKARMPRSLILEPTRELAAQVAENFAVYGKYHKLSTALLIGGESMGDQQRILMRGVDVLIATPGRLLDLFDRGNILMSDVKLLVIDEADRMLDMGFMPDVESIVAKLPWTRQTLFFSATMPKEIRRLADKFLTNPKEIMVSAPATTADTVSQYILRTSLKEKREALHTLLRSEQVKSALVFCNRKRDIAAVAQSLTRHGFSAGSLHGDLPQSVRMDTLDKFKRGEITILVASDVAARGLDIDDVSHVVNFDVPHHADDYVHRIGRTGRAGRSGRAFMLVTPEDGKALTAIEKLIKKNLVPLQVEGVSAPAERSPDAGDEATKKPSRSRKGANKRDGRKDAGKETSKDTDKESPRGGGDTRANDDKRRARAKSAPDADGKGEDRQDRDEPVRGLGDHTPAFLLRPVRRTA